MYHGNVVFPIVDIRFYDEPYGRTLKWYIDIPPEEASGGVIYICVSGHEQCVGSGLGHMSAYGLDADFDLLPEIFGNEFHN